MIKSFREQLQCDIENIFLTESEFAEIHSIGDGVNYIECPMVVYGTGQSALMSGVELRAGHIVAVLRTANVPENHSYGCTIFIDGKAYTIENEPVDSFGMMELLLKLNY